MRRALLLVLLLALVALQVKLWVGDGGFREVKELERSVHAQQIENEKLRQRNDALAAEVDALKNGDEAIEERARNESGLIKDGETFYRVIDRPADDESDSR